MADHKDHRPRKPKNSPAPIIPLPVVPMLPDGVINTAAIYRQLGETDLAQDQNTKAGSEESSTQDEPTPRETGEN